uniref:Uncharacterized protein n=1 Tax=Eutreptiella gymnastica TaxID=73025 RepID=A0A7S4G5X3_9EUGL
MAGNSCGHDFALLNHRLNASAMLYRKQAFRAFFYDLASSINNDSVSFLLVWGLIVAWCFVAYSSNIKDVALAAVAIGGLTQMRAMSMALQSLLQGLTQGYLMLLDVKEILNCPDVLDAAPQDKEGGPGTAAGAAPQK